MIDTKVIACFQAISDEISSGLIVKPETRLRELVNLDSLRLVQLIVELEDSIGCSLESSMSELRNLRTVGDYIRLIQSLPVPRE